MGVRAQQVADEFEAGHEKVRVNEGPDGRRSRAHATSKRCSGCCAGTFSRRRVSRAVGSSHDDNAQRALELIQAERSLAAFVWRYESPNNEGVPQTASTSAQSIALSKALKARGWKFVGPTTVFAFMQAIGLLNDHAEACVIRDEVRAARAAFEPPC
ncbi:DNA-3-methyladenine glycosylase I [Pseudaquabacterium terrae]|uniref:DNA-3-methyladenine glycosylase I n=1 Tax=Pseudaquabacterium terrae TaxID=2732868 RepID=UPI003CCE342D